MTDPQSGLSPVQICVNYTAKTSLKMAEKRASLVS